MTCLYSGVRLSLFICLLLSCSLAAAAEWRLYDDQGQVANYDQLIAKVQAGDVVDLNSARFAIIAELGAGKTTRVFDIGDGRALRLPIARGLFMDTWDYQNYITSTYDGFLVLRDAGVNVVPVDLNASRPPSFLIVGEISDEFTLADFLSGRPVLDSNETARVEAALIKFARSTAKFTLIGDFRASQLHWTGAEWMLFDYTARFEIAKSASARNVLDAVALPHKLKLKIRAAIEDERRTRGLSAGPTVRLAPLCQQVFR